jgi:hypothetical protein
MKEMLVFVDKEDLPELQGRCKVVQNLLEVQYEDLYE